MPLKGQRIHIDEHDRRILRFLKLHEHMVCRVLILPGYRQIKRGNPILLPQHGGINPGIRMAAADESDVDQSIPRVIELIHRRKIISRRILPPQYLINSVHHQRREHGKTDDTRDLPRRAAAAAPSGRFRFGLLRSGFPAFRYCLFLFCQHIK